MLLVLPEKPIGMQPQSIAIRAQQAIDLMLAPRGFRRRAWRTRAGTLR